MSAMCVGVGSSVARSHIWRYGGSAAAFPLPRSAWLDAERRAVQSAGAAGTAGTAGFVP
jgi:hypothetical protein